MLNAESPSAGGQLTETFDARPVLRWRDVRNYLLQLASLGIFFGLGLLVTVVAPVTRLLVGRDRVSQIGPRYVRWLFQFYAGWLQWAGLFRIHFEGQEKLESLRGAIIAPNHPGLLDAIFLMGHIPRATCVMRAGLMRNPCLSGVAGICDYIRNDRGAGLIRECRRKLDAGDNLLIFPEGTRTRVHARGVNSFKGGFALAAVLSGAPIQTVLIERSGVYLGKETSLVTAARIPIEITIRVGEVFHALPGETAKELSSRLEAYFRERLANTDDGVRLRN